MSDKTAKRCRQRDARKRTGTISSLSAGYVPKDVMKSWIETAGRRTPETVRRSASFCKKFPSSTRVTRWCERRLGLVIMDVRASRWKREGRGNHQGKIRVTLRRKHWTVDSDQCSIPAKVPEIEKSVGSSFRNRVQLGPYFFSALNLNFRLKLVEVSQLCSTSYATKCQQCRLRPINAGIEMSSRSTWRELAAQLATIRTAGGSDTHTFLHAI